MSPSSSRDRSSALASLWSSRSAEKGQARFDQRISDVAKSDKRQFNRAVNEQVEVGVRLEPPDRCAGADHADPDTAGQVSPEDAAHAVGLRGGQKQVVHGQFESELEVLHHSGHQLGMPTWVGRCELGRRHDAYQVAQCS